jgi:hypothetical protein
MNPIQPLPTIYEEIPLLVLKDWKEKEEKEKVNKMVNDHFKWLSEKNEKP